MTKKVNISFSKLLASNWVITLTATLIGVFLALYLNELVASNKLKNQKSIATKNILSEITANEERLVKSIVKHTELLDGMSFLNKYVNDEDELIAPSDSMAVLRAKHPNLVTITDSTQVSKGVFDYEGEIYIDLSIPHVQLTNIAWQTLKNSGVSSSYDFDCLMYLESIDKLTNEVLKKDQELFDYLSGLRDSGVKNERLLSHVKLLIQFEKSLLEIYKPREEELKDCR